MFINGSSSKIFLIPSINWFDVRSIKGNPSDKAPVKGICPVLWAKPKELEAMCKKHGLVVEEMKGVNVKFSSKAFWKMVFNRIVPEDLEFVFTNSLSTGYSGMAKKR